MDAPNPVRPADAPVRAEELPDWLSDLAGKNIRTVAKIASFRLTAKRFRDEFGFSDDVANSVRPENFEGTIAYALKSPSGTVFSASAKVDGSRMTLAVKSSQNGKVFHDGSVSFALPDSPAQLERFAQSVRTKMTELSVQAIRKRNEAKLREFRDLRKFEVASSDLWGILRQLERPETLRTGHETGGHWFSSPLLVKNGTLRFEGLALPEPKNVFSTPTSFAVNDPTGREYVLPNFESAKKRTFSKFENDLMAAAGIDAPLYNLNWHKHPGGPL